MCSTKQRMIEELRFVHVIEFFCFGVICFPQTEICVCAHIMLCAYEDRHMYECASGHCRARWTAECVCMCVWAPEWSVINEILSHPWCASKPKDFALACVLFRPPYRRAHTNNFLCSHKSTLRFTPMPTLLQIRPHIWPFGLLAPNPLDNWTVRSHTH